MPEPVVTALPANVVLGCAYSPTMLPTHRATRDVDGTSVCGGHVRAAVGWRQSLTSNEPVAN